MAITVEEVRNFGDRWLTTVMNRGTPAEQAAFFLDPDTRLYVQQGGVVMTFEDNYRVHCQLRNEFHQMGDFTVTPLNDSPERVLAKGVFYWQAEFADNRAPNVYKAMVAEEWMLERIPSGELKFLHYMSLFHQPLPDSAELSLS